MCTTTNDEYELSSPGAPDASTLKPAYLKKNFEVDNYLEEDDFHKEGGIMNKYTYFKATPYTSAENDQKSKFRSVYIFV